MGSEEVQKILVLLESFGGELTTLLGLRSGNFDDLQEQIEECCGSLNITLDEIIDILTEEASVYSATYTNFICQQQDNEDIDWEIRFHYYHCQQ